VVQVRLFALERSTRAKPVPRIYFVGVKKRLEKLVVQYGTVGLVVYLTSTCLVYAGFLLALQLGWRPEGAIAGAGVWVAAYIGTKVTQPFRIVGAMAVTPVILRVYGRVTGRSPAAPDPTG
jgi:hypothetical protein